MKRAELKKQNQFKTNNTMRTKTSILVLTKAFFILLVSCCLFSSCDGDAVIIEKQGYTIKIDTVYHYRIRTTKGKYDCMIRSQKFQLKDTVDYGF